MKKVALSFVVVSLFFLTSCGGEKEPNNTKEEKEVVIVQNNNSFDFAITEKHQTTDPIQIMDVISFQILSKIYEPLIRFDEKDLSLKPLIAKSWEISGDKLTYTFKLKKGVFFQDNTCFKDGKGRELKSADVIYSFKRIFTQKNSYAYNMLKNTIKGGNNYPESELTGLKAIDDYTVEFTLEKPSSNFLNVLAVVNTSIVAQEAIESNLVVGTGPFMYSKEGDTELSLTLSKNNNYHVLDGEGNKLPYISSVVYHYIESRKEQLDMFMENKLDVISSIPSSAVKKLVEGQISDFQNKPVKYLLNRHVQNTTSFLNFNTAIAPFNNVKIRRAFAMAIDKTKIVDKILNGESAGAGAHGIVPSGIKNYDISSVIGYEFDVEKAKEMLSEAGYANGNNFPTITFATINGNKSVKVGLEIQKQLLSNLNINVEIAPYSLSEITALNGESKINMALGGWLGEFPTPVTFLSLFYGKDVPASNEESAYPNESRFQNSKFDKLYEEALITVDKNKMYEICLAADQIIASEVPVIPLWYHENYQLIQSSVKNYHPNALNSQFLTNVKLSFNTKK